MPKNKRSSNSRKSRGGVSMNSNSIVPFKFTVTSNASSSGDTPTATDLALQFMGNRLDSFVGSFKKWRLRKLRIKVVLDSAATSDQENSPGVMFAVGFLGTASTNVTALPATIAQVLDLVYSDLTNGYKPAVVSVPFSTLHESANSDWLATSAVGLSGQSLQYTAGCIVTDLHLGQSVDQGSVRWYTIVSGIAEFCEPTDPTVGLSMSLLPPSRVSQKVTSADEEKIQSVIQKATPKSALQDPKLTAKEMTQLHFLLGRLLKGQKLPDMDSWADDCDSHQVSEDEDDEKA